MSSSLRWGLGTILLLLAQALAHAQDVPPDVQIAPTVEPIEAGPEANIDLQNVVTTAAKIGTTVQEAPGIVTVLSADDLRRWGYRTLEDALADVPGWYRYDAEGESVPYVTTRGTLQGMLLMRDGVSLFDPFANVAAINRSVPLESIRRIEIVTGPGGVLWGANSFLGIANLISKDASDVDGVEASAGYGDGRGNQSDFRAWALAGKELLGGRLKLFAHASFESYIGQELEARPLAVGPIPPQPSGLLIYGALARSDVQRSWLLNVDGNVSSGPLTLSWYWSDGRMRWPGTFPFGLVQQQVPPGSPVGPNATNDPNGVGTDSAITRFDRLVALAYRPRLAPWLTMDAKAYAAQFVFRFEPIVFFPPSMLLHGGLVGDADPSAYRTGTTIDAVLSLPFAARLLVGGEAFYEATPGATLTLRSPDPAASMGPSGLPFLCPHSAPRAYVPQCPVAFVFAASRNVGAVYGSAEWRPVPTVVLEGGTRLQAGFGDRPYDPLVLASGNLVWNFARNWHVKANFAQGFRPPVFNNTDANGSAAEYAGNRSIKNEFSTSWQGEINARVLRQVRRVRELDVRADYSYSILDNVIVINQGAYANTSRRGISAADFLATAYLLGDHSLRLGYSFVRIADEARGYVAATPQHWFSTGASFNLIRDRLDVVTTLLVAGALQDPNRLPRIDQCPGMAPTPANCGSSASASMLSLDRIPPTATLNLGLRLRGFLDERLELDVYAYNVLDQHGYQPDAFYDFVPSTESQPFPQPGLSVFAHARFRY